jgi:serine protease AprX
MFKGCFLKKIIVLPLIAFLCNSFPAVAQYSRYIIQFSDKKNTPFSFSNPAAFLSGRAIQRRSKQHLEMDSTDLPIVPGYLDGIAAIPNLQVLNHSKWFNQVLIKTDDSNALAAARLLSFVKNVSPVALMRLTRVPDSAFIKINEAARFLHMESVTGAQQSAQTNGTSGTTGNALNYGNSYTQIHMHRGEWLHNLGFKGEGMVIAILDDGFLGYLTNPAFDSIRQGNQVLGTYDYVHNKASVDQEDIHGAYCLSIIAANEPGIFAGSAPAATFWLLKTEDTDSEYPVEEQNWVAAAEFADSVGTDLITTSLGYDYFDDPVFDHDYASRDGHSTLISRAANFAVAKGMIVTASAGNSGNGRGETKYVDCPADADSVLTVGAVDPNKAIAIFSSRGPNSAGLLKPNVVSLGEGTIVAQPDGSVTLGNGTSFSNPNIAGLVTCLWQAFPEFNNHDIIDAVQQSADRYSDPNDQYGYGIPDFQKAYQSLLARKYFLQYTSTAGNPLISVYPVPFDADFTVVYKPTTTGTATLRLMDVTGRTIETKSVAVTAGLFGFTQFVSASRLAKGVYFIRYDDGHDKITLRTIRN